MADAEDKAQSEQQAKAVEVTAGEGLIESMIANFETTAAGLSPDVREVTRDLIGFLRERMKTVKVDVALINNIMSELDALIGSQLDEILHHEKFQKLESAWTGLYWLITRTDFKENIRVELLCASKKDLQQDFEEAAGDVTTSGLFEHIYRSQYGAPNGKPYGAMVVNYEFNHHAPDMALLSDLAKVAAMAHAPVISAVGPELFGPKGYEHLTDPKYSVVEAFAGKEHAKWNSFREDQNSMYVGLTLPHFLLRLPYNRKDNPVDEKEFRYEERIAGKHNNYLWGNSAFAFASRLTEAFKKWRWCWRIVGEQSGGAIDDLKLHVFEQNGEMVQKPPTEVALALDREFQLSEAGLIPLMWMREKDQSVIYGASSVRKPKKYPDTEEGNKKERDDKLRSRLPYIFILTRFAHYLKRIQTTYIGKPVTSGTIKRELEEWIKQYVNNVDDPQPGTLGKQPLKNYSINVQEDPKSPGVFLCDIKLTPHTLAEGFTATLSLVTRQELGKK